MKNAAKFLLAATLLTAATAASAGEFLTVEVKGRVASVDDPGNLLDGKIAYGQVVTGNYKYDIHVPDQTSDPGLGVYPQPYGSVRLAVGSLVFESEPASGMAAGEVLVVPQSPNNNGALFIVTSETNKPLPDGTPVSQIQFQFEDPAGQVPATDALPVTAPNLLSFNYPTATLYGAVNGQYYFVVIELEAAYSDGTQSDLVISPGKSTFVSGQRFDVALLLPPGSGVMRVTSSLDGQPLPMSFPGNCNFAPPNSQNRPTIICPDAQLHLPSVEGQQRVEWEVELSDGTVIWNPVEWTLIQ